MTERVGLWRQPQQSARFAQKSPAADLFLDLYSSVLRVGWLSLVCGTVCGPLSPWRPLHWGGPAPPEPFLFLLEVLLPHSAMGRCLHAAPSASVLSNLVPCAALPAAASAHASLRPSVTLLLLLLVTIDSALCGPCQEWD